MELFYLKSRGIHEEKAKKMLFNAFAEDALLKIDSDSVRHQLENKLSIT